MRLILGVARLGIDVIHHGKREEVCHGSGGSVSGRFRFDEVTVDVNGERVKKKVRRSEAERLAYYRKKWRTWQMSDQKLMWVELKTDFTEDYLKSLKPA